MTVPANEQAPAIRVSGLTTCFGSTTVHDRLELTVRRGELLAVVGGSGSGKTVLLRHLTLLRRPAEGSVQVLGVNVAGCGERDLRPLRRRIGVMFQQGALFTGLTVLENVCLPLREHTCLTGDLIRELAMAKIGLSGLPAEAAHKYPAELSGGMTKRAALARAIALDPELLFLDEPTAGLDPVGAAALDELIAQLQELMGLTVVMVTHDADSLWQITDRVAFLADQRVVEVGPMAELARSRHPEICRYFSGPRMRRAQERAQ